MEEQITMSTKEANRISILEKLKTKELQQKKAANILGLSVRHVRRLFQKYQRDGAAGITHRLRGIPSNNRADAKTLDIAVGVVKTQYHDFTITLAHEKLIAHHQFSYSIETLRHALIRDGFWHPKRQPKPVIYQIRERRSSEGELIQIDGSPYAWFEDRGPYCTLLVYIDDATGKLLWLEFTESETTNAYFLATKQYLEKYGKPLAFYSDKHGVFRVNTTKAKTAGTEDNNGLTQFGRAMKELNIEPIFANSPQAKGRVERVNQTLQDRLVKELRLLNISTMEDANRYLPTFMDEFNRRFAVIPKSSVNMHRPLTQKDRLDQILIQKHTRILSKQLTLSYGNRIYQIQTNHPTYAMRHAPVTVQEDARGTIFLVYKQQQLAYKVIVHQPRLDIVDTKHLNHVVDRLTERVWTKPEVTHPWRQPYLYW